MWSELPVWSETVPLTTTSFEKLWSWGHPNLKETTWEHYLRQQKLLNCPSRSGWILADTTGAPFQPRNVFHPWETMPRCWQALQVWLLWLAHRLTYRFGKLANAVKHNAGYVQKQTPLKSAMVQLQILNCVADEIFSTMSGWKTLWTQFSSL